MNEHSVLGQVVDKMCIWLLQTAPMIMTEHISQVLYRFCISCAVAKQHVEKKQHVSQSLII